MLDMQEYLVTEFVEEYEDGNLSRVDLERRVVGILGREVGHSLLADVPARAEVGTTRGQSAASPQRNTSGLKAEDVRITVDGAELRGYLVRPDGEGTWPGIVAIHENRGLVEHIRDCARRLAAEGYVVLAPDLLSRQGGTGKFADPNDAIAALGVSNPDENTRDLVAALEWLGQCKEVNGKLGVTGWCMGGGYAWRVATQAGDRLQAAVPWYGPNPPGGVENIAAPIFAIYGELDQRINAGIDSITQQLQLHGKSFEKKVYPGAQHAFNNDTNAERYNAEQAPIAWNDMLAFFGRTLKAA